MKIFWGIPAVVATAALAWNSPSAQAGHCGCTTYPAASAPVCDNQTGFASALAKLRPSNLLGGLGLGGNGGGGGNNGGVGRDANGTIAGYDTVTETRMTTAYQSVNETVMTPVTRTVLKDEARTSYQTVTSTECKTVSETVCKPATTTVMKEVPFTKQVPVTTTVNTVVNSTVCKPVTETVMKECRDPVYRNVTETAYKECTYTVSHTGWQA